MSPVLSVTYVPGRTLDYKHRHVGYRGEGAVTDYENTRVQVDGAVLCHYGTRMTATLAQTTATVTLSTTHVIFDPLDFIAKLASLVPKPKVNLARFHGVFAGAPDRPNSKHKITLTPARRGKGRRKAIGQDKTPEERHSAMTGFCSCKPGIHAIHGNNRFLLLQTRHTCHPWQ